jgi:hypothetical protein
MYKYTADLLPPFQLVLGEEEEATPLDYQVLQGTRQWKSKATKSIVKIANQHAPRFRLISPPDLVLEGCRQ